jgi:anti-sigma B factor antagonist
MDLGLDVSERDGYTVLAVRGEVDVYTAPRFRERLIELVSEGKHRIIIDLEGVDFLDSTGLGVLVGGLKRLRSHDGDLLPHPEGLRDHWPNQGLLHLRLGRRRRRRVGADAAPVR